MRSTGADGAPAVSADLLCEAVRAHADRVHDFVRRQGCPPQASPGVVEDSALDLLAGAADAPAPVTELVGRWFALAGAQARQAGPGDTWPPVGRGPLAGTAEQELLAAGLARRDERGRRALLLSDAYDLPPETVGAALGVDPRTALRLVGSARLELLPDVFDGAVPEVAGHVDDDALARLAGGSGLAGRSVLAGDGRAARHVRDCDACTPALHAQEDVRRLLAGLSVVALPDDGRGAMLERVALRARTLLPTATPALEQEYEPDEPRRLLSPGPVLLALLLAVLGGVGLGVLLSRPHPVKAAAVGVLPEVTTSPLAALGAGPPRGPASASPAAAPLPTTTVFTYPPIAPAATATTAAPATTTPPTLPPPPTPPSPSGAPATSAPPTVTSTVVVAPVAGPGGATLSVTGTGWAPGSTVIIAFLDPLGRPTGDTAAAVATNAGRIRTTLQAGAADAAPGDYRVQAGDGTRTARTTYTVLA